MATKAELSDDDSFIVLGSSPGPSIEEYLSKSAVKLGAASLDQSNASNTQMTSEQYLKPQPVNFKLGNMSIDSSAMAASRYSDSTEEHTATQLQSRFGEILDENTILKETLKKNNESMKEQFLMIMSCQEDMLKIHDVHREKFEQTKELVEKLRKENKKLKMEIALRQQEDELGAAQHNSHTSLNGSQHMHNSQFAKSDFESNYHDKSGRSSALEFVTSPDEDTINKLTAQLDLVEKQRRNVITENQKLTWQKRSLEHLIDLSVEEKTELEKKIAQLESEVKSKDEEIKKITEVAETLRTALNDTIPLSEYQDKKEFMKQKFAELEAKFKNACLKINQLEEEKKQEDDGRFPNKLELVRDLQMTKLKVLELEDLKMENAQYKSTMSATNKMYKQEIEQLKAKLEKAETMMFNPTYKPLSDNDPDYESLKSHIDTYDETFSNLQYFIKTAEVCSLDTLEQISNFMLKIRDNADENTLRKIEDDMESLERKVHENHAWVKQHVLKLKNSMKRFGNIIRDYDEILKRSALKQESQQADKSSVPELTAALVARGEEVQSLQEKLRQLQVDKEEKEVLKAQLELYKSDFEAEREAREMMACEKEAIATDLRNSQRIVQQLEKKIEQALAVDPNLFRNAESSRPKPQEGTSTSRGRGRGISSSTPTSTSTTGNMVYKCPKCMRFSADQYKVMEDHFDFCLDDF